MTKIFDLAQNFEQKSQQQATATEEALKREFERHENTIKEALQQSTNSIVNDLEAQQKGMNSFILKGWLMVLLAFVTMFVVSWGVLFFQGKLIADNYQLISEQKQALQQLESKTWGLSLHQDQDGKFIVLPKGTVALTGWSMNKGKNQLVKLEKE